MLLRTALVNSGSTQSELAAYLGLAKSTVSQIVNRGQFPKGGEKDIRKKINDYLIDRGVTPSGLWKKASIETEAEEIGQECVMISAEAKKKFKLFRDPFLDDVRGKQDVYMSRDSRFAWEYMYATARLGGMLAVIGESGSGKTTLRRLLLDRINSEDLKIKVIFPRIIDKGRLTATSICDAIIRDCSTEKPKRTLEGKAHQIERILTHSLKSGWKHVLMIEEAHDLTIQTLKYLKRFWELESGFEKLLAIILMAQPELKEKLDESRNYEAREIIRRMEIAELKALDTEKELKEYIALKFSRVGLRTEQMIKDDTYGAILKKLTRPTRSKREICLAYPLTINNIIKRAMNIAAEFGQDEIDSATIESV